MVTSDRKHPACRLLVRPVPLRGESLRGYLLRVGECNGLGKGINLFKFFTGSKYGNYWVSDSALESIAHSLALNKAQVEFMSYQPAAPGVKGKCIFFGHTIARYHLRRTRPSVCPACLGEQQAVNGLWDLTAVNACTRHGTWLIDRCPSCGEAFRWNRARVAKCQCGFDLKAAKAEAAPFEVLAQTALIQEIVFQDFPTFDEHSFAGPQWVRQLSLNELLGFFHYVADVLALAHPSHGSVTDPYGKHGHIALVFSEILKDWPGGLWSLLTHFSKYDAADVVLTPSKFNSTYLRVLRVIHTPQAAHMEVPDLLKQAVEQFRSDHCIPGISYFERKRYLNPSAVWRSTEGQRMMKLKDFLLALRLQTASQHLGEIVPFSTFLSNKSLKISPIFPERSDAAHGFIARP